MSRPTAGSTTSPATAVPNDCEPSDWQSAEVLVPIFDHANGLNGSNGEYHVAGFAGFRMSGYRFPGNDVGERLPVRTKAKGRHDLHLR